MNGLEKLTGQIDADVQKEIDAALVQARSQAQEIQSWYESQAQIQVEAIRRKGQQDAVSVRSGWWTKQKCRLVGTFWPPNRS